MTKRIGTIAVVGFVFSACSPSETGEAKCPTAPAPTRLSPPLHDARTTPPRPVGWASSANSSSTRDQTRNPKSCFAAAGCPYAPHSLPRCPPEAAPDPNWWDLGRVGSVVIAPGNLETLFGSTTQAGCSVVHPCCNTERAQLVVRTTYGRITLTSPSNPFAFQCVGDQSADCCPFAPGQTVLVKGLMSAPYAFNNYTMADPELCVVER